MKNLRKQFCDDNQQYKNISYTTFCRIRPFWITIPHATFCETCLCKLKVLKLTEENSTSDHQHNSEDEIKKSLNLDEILLHIVFRRTISVNTARRFSPHISADQSHRSLRILLMLYYCNPLTGLKSHQSFVTLPENNQYEPVAIAAHLEPMMPSVSVIHFLSDGPSAQYKNKQMFQIFGSFLSWLYAKEMFWHYLESGHGKCAPDGIGGSVKRTADAIVAKDEDIPDFPTLVTKLQENLKSITVIPVEESAIMKIKSIIPRNAEVVTGTTK
ncbi:hypothetical protein PR048_010717, partial [Dryococelus australis]